MTIEISENLCSLAEHTAQSLRNRMVKMIFENLNYLMFKIGRKNCCSYNVHIQVKLPWGKNFDNFFLTVPLFLF